MHLRSFASLPPHTKVGMPALSPTMSQGSIAKWYVKEGDTVSAGTVLADIETDKATLAFENQDDGYIARVLVPEGTRDIPIGAPVLIMVEEKADIKAFASYTQEQAGDGGGGGSSKTSKPSSSSTAPPQRQQQPKDKPAAAQKSSGGGVAKKGSGSGSALPAHTLLTMPSLSPTMERGSIVNWQVKEGSALQPGDILAEVETDKATLGWENQDEGWLARILRPAGSRDVTVGEPLAIIVEDEADVAKFKDFDPSGTPSAGSETTASAEPSRSAEASGPNTDSSSTSRSSGPANFRVGPSVQYYLRQYNLAIEDVTPTGPNNIVTKADVIQAGESGTKSKASAPAAAAQPKQQSQPAAAAKTPPAASPAAPSKPKPAAKSAAPAAASDSYEDIPNSQIRRIIAQRLLESKQRIPALYATVQADLGPLTKLRASLAEQGTKLSVNDFIIKAVAAALRDVPEANVYWDDKAGAVQQQRDVDISVAVATPRGLITPIVRKADTRPLMEVSRAVKDLAARARDNKLKPDEFQGGTFTISNLGMYGIANFAAIINPPQAAILAVGGPQQQVVLQDGRPVGRIVMSVTLSADHRVYDGELTNRLLQAFRRHLENPIALVMG